MFAIRVENYLTGSVYYTKCSDYASACQRMREIEADMLDASWIEGEDYQLCVVEVPDDFDFDNQKEWN